MCGFYYISLLLLLLSLSLLLVVVVVVVVVVVFMNIYTDWYFSINTGIDIRPVA